MFSCNESIRYGADMACKIGQKSLDFFLLLTIKLYQGVLLINEFEGLDVDRLARR